MRQALVVDDSATMRMVLARFLRDRGWTVSQAGDGSAALAAVDAGLDPNLVLLDWNMPIMDGMTCAMALREPPRSYRGPILMVTTESDVDQMAAALAGPITEYLLKPFDLEALDSKLAILGLATDA